jgi:hypothetical protein
VRDLASAYKDVASIDTKLLGTDRPRCALDVLNQVSSDLDSLVTGQLQPGQRGQIITVVNSHEDVEKIRAEGARSGGLEPGAVADEPTPADLRSETRSTEGGQHGNP